MQILETILRTPGHFDAETLRLRLRAQGRRLSRATIYRTLGLLLASGIVKRTRLVEAALHYEIAKSRDAHHHLVCRGCGAVIEVSDAPLAKALADLVRRSAFSAEEVAVSIRGLCSTCREAVGRNQSPGASGKQLN